MPTEGREQDTMTEQELRHVTHQEILDALKEAVTERGADFVYPVNWRRDFETKRDQLEGRDDVVGAEYGNCQNYLIVGDGEVKPACIAGYVYDKLGILDEMVKHDQEQGMYYQVSGVSAVFARGTAGGGSKRMFGGVVIDEIDVAALIHAQSAQDEERPWGEALEEAEAILEPVIQREAEEQAQFEADFGGDDE
jgi:hypothetical protein